MKRFMKGCAILALIFCIVGCALEIVGSAMTDGTEIEDAVKTVTKGKVNFHRDPWWGWDMNVVEDRVDRIELAASEASREQKPVDSVQEDFAVEEASGYEVVKDSDALFNQNYEIVTGSVNPYCPGENIQNLDIEAGGCEFLTVYSPDDRIYLEVQDAYRFQGYVKGGTLHIKEKAALSEGIDCCITLYLPEGYRFREVEVQLGAGNFYFTDLRGEKISLEAGAGEVTMDRVEANELDLALGAGYINLNAMEVNELEAEVGMGELYAQGRLTGDTDVECSMGSVTMELENSQAEFNYHLEGALGNISLGNNSYSGLGNEQEINNHASKDMDIECSMGSISVFFSD